MYKRNLGFLGYLLSSGLCLMIMITPASAEVNPQSIIQIFQRLEILEKRSRELTGENEVLKHQIGQLKKVQKQGFLNVDEQIDEVRQSMKEKKTAQTTPIIEPTAIETPVVKPAPAVPVKPETPAAKPAATDDKKETTNTKPETSLPIVKTDGVKTIPPTAEELAEVESKGKIRAPTAYEKETYQAAFNTMSASPSAATKAFKEYIKLQPKSPLAANAQYWIGEIMYSHNNYKGAVQEFIKVLQQYKTSSKAPDAAIKLGYSFYALKNWTYARRTFEDVLKYFPDNKNAVSLATKRLEKMKAAGN
ncbi:MAG: tol-pal system protein YbgF [Cocleimonas sp.]